jgi:hypothetical protein
MQSPRRDRSARSKDLSFEFKLIATHSSFFITNDHWAHPTTFLGIPRIFQALFGPFHWASSVVHCSTVKGKAQCKTVSPSNYHPSANGAVLVDEGKTLLVNDLIKAKTIVYDVHPVSKMLTVRKEIVCFNRSHPSLEIRLTGIP